MSDSVQDYFNEIARYPLLTVQQEIQLSRQVQAGIALEGVEHPDAQQQRILRVALRAKQKLIRCNLRLVVNVAKKYRNRLQESRCMDFMDLVQEGNIGLHRAVELFDGTRGYKFSTYAYWWIRQAMSRGLDSRDRLIRIPQHHLDMIYKIARFNKNYLQEHGRMPGLAKTAAYLEVDIDFLNTLLARSATPRSLDETVLENGSSSLGDLIPDLDALDKQGDYIELEERALMLEVAMTCLTEDELQMLKQRYGMEGKEPASMSSIAKECGVSRERVRQRIEQAHLKMRLKLRSAGHV